MKFSNKIKHILVDCGISEAELARRLKISPQAFNRKMHTDNFSTRDLEEIATALGISFEAYFVLPNGNKL